MKTPLRQTTFLFLYLTVLTFPLLGQSQEELNRDLVNMIYNENIDYNTATSYFRKGADPNFRNPEGRTLFHYYMLWVEERNKPGFHKDDYESIISAFLAAGAQPANTDTTGDSALSTMMRLSNKYEQMIPLLELMLQYADANEIKTAEAMVAKTIAREKRTNFFPNLRPFITTFGFPLIVGSLSIGMREGAYRSDPSRNFMGLINGAFDFTIGGIAFGALLFAPGGGQGMLIGGLIGGFAGLLGGVIAVAAVPSIGRYINDNPVLYYAPTVVSALLSIVIFKLSY
jgi:hypothetical protein